MINISSYSPINARIYACSTHTRARTFNPIVLFCLSFFLSWLPRFTDHPKPCTSFFCRLLPLETPSHTWFLFRKSKCHFPGNELCNCNAFGQKFAAHCPWFFVLCCTSVSIDSPSWIEQKKNRTFACVYTHFYLWSRAISLFLSDLSPITRLGPPFDLSWPEADPVAIAWPCM